MNSPLRWILAAALLLATPSTAVRPGGETPSASGAPTLLLLVRHAEKAVGGPDPDLDPRGRERAAELARVLADLQVDALYASQYRRAQQTLRPLGLRKDLPVGVQPVEGSIDAWAERFAVLLLDRHRGQTVVVAGHSNTTPALARALGAAGAPDLDDDDYDDLFWIVLGAGGVRFVHLHYGAVSD